MIGIPALDNLSTFELIKITWGYTMIVIPEPEPLQVSLDPNEEPQLQQSYKTMDNDKIITLCKMEIESRFGWDYLAQKIQNTEKEEGKTR